MGWQIVVAAAVGVALLLLANHEPSLYSTRLIFPFFKRLIPDLGWFYVAVRGASFSSARPTRST